MRRIKQDNRGIALITVVIGVMFCLLLTSTMLRVSILGLQSRGINNQTSDNFYDAEGVIDTIRLNLQNIAAKAWRETSNETSSANFVSKTYQLLTNTSYPSSWPVTLSDTAKLHVVAELQNNTADDGRVLGFVGIERFYGETGKLEGLIIKGVEVEYRNSDNNMVSYIKSDIIIRAPLFASKKKYPLASYSMFAGSGATSWSSEAGQRDDSSGVYTRQLDMGKNGSAHLRNPENTGIWEQQGNVYIGYSSSSTNKNALMISDRQTMIFSGDNVVINGNVVITRCSNLQLTGEDVEIRGKIYIGPDCHLILSTTTNLSCQDICFFNNDPSDLQANDWGTLTPNSSVVARSASWPDKTYNYTPNEARKAGKYKDTYLTNADHSVCYIDTTGKVKTAKVTSQGELKTQDLKATLSITFGDKFDASVEGKVKHGGNLADPTELDPKPRRKGIKEDGTETAKEYDDFFLEMINVGYFEEFCKTAAAKQARMNKKYDLSALYTKPLDVPDVVDPTGTITGNSGRTITFENPMVDGQKFKEKYWTGSNWGEREVNSLPITVYFTADTGTGNGNIVNSNNFPFVLSCRSVFINVDGNDDRYCGIVITPEFLQVKKDNGYCTGYSFLNMESTLSDGRTNVEKFMMTVGSMMSDTAADALNGVDKKYMLYNNLFNGGIKRFYKKETGSGGGVKYVPDSAHNSSIDLIDIQNYDKHFEPMTPIPTPPEGD